jgi:hypothetical protein
MYHGCFHGVKPLPGATRDACLKLKDLKVVRDVPLYDPKNDPKGNPMRGPFVVECSDSRLDDHFPATWDDCVYRLRKRAAEAWNRSANTFDLTEYQRLSGCECKPSSVPLPLPTQRGSIRVRP